MLESQYKRQLKGRLEKRFPGCLVLRLDANLTQGIPDMLILWGERWASLEGKRSPNEPYRPNQEYYIQVMNGMSFSAMICPENEEEVLDELQRTWELRW